MPKYSLDEVAYLAAQMGGKKWVVIDKLNFGIRATNAIALGERMRCNDVLGLWAVQRRHIGPELHAFFEGVLEDSFISESQPDRYTLNQLAHYQMTLMSPARIQEKLLSQGESEETVDAITDAYHSSGTNLGKWWLSIPACYKNAAATMLRQELRPHDAPSP